MSETQTLDPPAETEAATPSETEDAPLNEDVTDAQDDAVQTDAAESSEETPEQHEAKLEADRLEAERAAIREEERQRVESEKAQEQKTAQEAARKEQVKQAFPRAVRDMDALLDRFDAGEELTRKQFTDVLAGLNLVAESAAEERVSDRYREAFAEKLGDEAEAFWKEADALKEEDGSIPVAALLDLYAEKRALQAKPVKSMTLDQAKSASPVLARELATALKAEFDKGRKAPLPAGEPGSDGSTLTPRGRMTAEEAATMDINELIARRRAG